MLSRSGAILCLLLLVSFSGRSQILNVEKFRLSKDTSNVFSGRVELSFSATKNQNTLLNLNNQSHLIYLSEKHMYLLISNIQFIKFEEQNLFSNGYFHGRTNFFRQQAVSFELFGQYQYDENRGMLKRILEGADLRIRLVDKDQWSLYFSTGAMLEYEEWRLEEEQIEYRHLFKSTNYLSFNFELNERVNFHSITYYQAKPETFLQPRISSDNKLNTQLTKHLDLTLSYNLLYDANPVIDIDPYNYSFSSGITLHF